MINEMNHITVQVENEVKQVSSRRSRVISPVPRDIWREVLDADPLALVDQSPEWMDVICSIGDYEDASRLYELDGIRMVLPMVRRSGLPLMFNDESSFPPGWGIGGLLSTRPPEVEELELVMMDLAQQPGMRKTIRPDPLKGRLWANAVPKGTITQPRLAHVLDLEGGFEKVWSQRFNSLTRRNIRKAENSNLVVECDSSGKLVPVFYNLFMQSIDRWAAKQHEPAALARWRARQRDPIKKIEAISQVLGPRHHIWVAWSEGEPAAAILVLQGKNAHYTRGAMNKKLAGPTRANDLLHKMAIEQACLAGCRYYHMGETGESESLARYKARFGAEPVRYAQYVIERLPLTLADSWLRTIIKRLIGFKDAG